MSVYSYYQYRAHQWPLQKPQENIYSPSAVYDARKQPKKETDVNVRTYMFPRPIETEHWTKKMSSSSSSQLLPLQPAPTDQKRTRLRPIALHDVFPVSHGFCGVVSVFPPHSSQGHGSTGECRWDWANPPIRIPIPHLRAS